MGRKSRSPNYPRLPLREAIERITKVHKSERTHKVAREAVAKALNYGGLNGASLTLIGTLKSYGLLEEDKEGVKVSGDAVTILRAPESDPDKAVALRKAAFAPRIFDELRETYGDDPHELPSDATMQYRLERKGFLEKAAGEVIRTYRDNLEFVSEQAAEYTEADELVDEQPVEAPQMQPQPTIVPQPIAPQHAGNVIAPIPIGGAEQDSSIETLQYRISGESKVRLLFDGAVTKEAIEKLMAYLELAKDDYPSKEQVQRPLSVEGPAEQTAIELPAPE